MISHHFIGTGVWSEALHRGQQDPEQLLAEVAGHVRACHLQVMATQAVPFDQGGLTLVWVLAESHLVLHVWPELQSATLDLHVCNFGTSNAANARALRDRLAAACFATGGHWAEVVAGAGTDEDAQLSVGPVLGSGVDPFVAGGVDRHRSADRITFMEETTTNGGDQNALQRSSTS